MTVNATEKYDRSELTDRLVRTIREFRRGRGPVLKPLNVPSGVQVGLKVVLALVALVLLTGFGGEGAYAAPITLPLLWFATRHTASRWRWALVVIASLTGFEAGWVLVYAVSGAGTVYEGGVASADPQVGALALGILAGVVAALIFGWTARTAGRWHTDVATPVTDGRS